MTPLDPPRSFLDACRTVGLSLEADELSRLGGYLARLLDETTRVNLTAIREPEPAWQRHILESLALLGHLSGVRSLIDVGSGGGMPGLPVAIARPDLRVTLLEATGKKARFLQRVADELALANVTVINDRSETIARSKQHRQRYDAATARAVGPLNVLLELTLPLVRVGGRLLAMKGAKVGDELRDAGDALMLLGGGEVEVYEALPGMDDEAVIVEVQKTHPTPGEYPRRPGIPKQEPL